MDLGPPLDKLRPHALFVANGGEAECLHCRQRFQFHTELDPKITPETRIKGLSAYLAASPTKRICAAWREAWINWSNHVLSPSMGYPEIQPWQVVYLGVANPDKQIRKLMPQMHRIDTIKRLDTGNLVDPYTIEEAVLYTTLEGNHLNADFVSNRTQSNWPSARKCAF